MENMENHTSSSIIIGTEDWTPIGDLSNDNISIFIQKNLNIRPIDARDNQDGVNEQGGEVITKKDETNPNGIEVFKSISTIPDPDSNKNLNIMKCILTMRTVQLIVFLFMDMIQKMRSLLKRRIWYLTP